MQHPLIVWLRSMLTLEIEAPVWCLIATAVIVAALLVAAGYGLGELT
jgi:hypothetical protein